MNFYRIIIRFFAGLILFLPALNGQAQGPPIFTETPIVLMDLKNSSTG